MQTMKNRKLTKCFRIVDTANEKCTSCITFISPPYNQYLTETVASYWDQSLWPRIYNRTSTKLCWPRLILDQNMFWQWSPYVLLSEWKYFILPRYWVSEIIGFSEFNTRLHLHTSRNDHYLYISTCADIKNICLLNNFSNVSYWFYNIQV